MLERRIREDPINNEESHIKTLRWATYCQKLINDALLHAKCGQLTAQSCIETGFQTSDSYNECILTAYNNMSSTW